MVLKGAFQRVDLLDRPLARCVMYWLASARIQLGRARCDLYISLSSGLASSISQMHRYLSTPLPSTNLNRRALT